jgi:parallel beta-helix repeat protein
MKFQHLRLAIAALVSFHFSIFAATVHYVDANGINPVAPYTSWATAATNIQDTVFYGGTILVTNGIYQYGTYLASGNNRVYIPNNETVQSVNGPAVTTIMGYQVPGTTNGVKAVRCVYLSNGSTLSGFTLTNGATQTSGTPFGGGVYCQSTSAVLTNCVIIGNAALVGGGTYSGTLINCTLSGNISGSAGGANSAALINCVLSGNAATSGGGVGGGGAASSTLTNCLISGNRSAYPGGGVTGGILVNCTVVSNTASSSAGVSVGTTLKNCIVYDNSPDNGGGNFTNCCTTPLPSSGANNTTNPPAFVDLAGGDFHLLPWSPCINAGNNSFITNATDLDGNPRIVAGTVDIGAYEFQSPIHYVSISNTAPVSPFTNWITAATNIQDAIDAASAGDFIVVSNGTYSTGGRAVYGAATNRVTVDKAVTVQSVNGPSSTIIAGINFTPPYNVRCVYLTNGAALIGFTMTNGGATAIGDSVREQSGGGIWCESLSVIVSNCIISGNISPNYYGGGVFRGTLFSCILTNNSASGGGGAASNVLFNCTLMHNSAYQIQDASGGGGAYGCILNNCLITANQSTTGKILGNGGGAAFSMLASCIISNNSATGNGGGLYFGAANNSLISSNRASSGGGAYSNILNNCILQNNFAGNTGGGAFNSALVNCAVVSNAAPIPAPAPTGGGVTGGSLNNCILYYNSGAGGSNFLGNVAINYCCTTPLPTNGVGNITNAPLFVNVTNDFHLQSNSPCINAGNNSYITNTTDFDGNPRIVGGTVDIGAYEYQTPSSILSYAWAQQYGLPTDGSADYLDSDGDGMNNWQEWKAGTIPTNAASVLKLSSPSNSVSGVTVTWQSVGGVTYYLQSSTNLAAQPAFSSIQSNILGQAGSTSYTDTTATNGGPYFYRVGVQ